MIGSGSPWAEIRREPPKDGNDFGWGSLTATELEVVVFLRDGLSNPEIAAVLMVSRRTVATHVEHILWKLGLRSRLEVAREATLRR